jgi:hypothetical protein
VADILIIKGFFIVVDFKKITILRSHRSKDRFRISIVDPDPNPVGSKSGRIRNFYQDPDTEIIPDPGSSRSEMNFK